jgi:hypothetical protein
MSVKQDSVVELRVERLGHARPAMLNPAVKQVSPDRDAQPRRSRAASEVVFPITVVRSVAKSMRNRPGACRACENSEFHAWRDLLMHPEFSDGAGISNGAARCWSQCGIRETQPTGLKLEMCAESPPNQCILAPRDV